MFHGSNPMTVTIPTVTRLDASAKPNFNAKLKLQPLKKHFCCCRRRSDPCIQSTGTSILSIKDQYNVLRTRQLYRIPGHRQLRDALSELESEYEGDLSIKRFFSQRPNTTGCSATWGRLQANCGVHVEAHILPTR